MLPLGRYSPVGTGQDHVPRVTTDSGPTSTEARIPEGERECVDGLSSRDLPKVTTSAPGSWISHTVSTK